MTQIVQGKNREIQPLVPRGRPMYQAQDYTPQDFIAPQEQFFHTPKKNGQFAYGDELMDTQGSSPFIRNPAVDANPAPFASYEEIPMRYTSPVRGTAGA